MGAAPRTEADAGEPPLGGVRVLELGDSLAGAYCGRQFAQWGADVVVIEDAAGSAIRRLPPHAAAGDGSRTSLVWEALAANKRAVVADRPDELRALMRCADVLVTDLETQALEPLGISPTSLEDDFPGLCVVLLSPFGRSGPYAGFKAAPIVVEALSGYLSLNGFADRAPLRAPGLLTTYAVGASAFAAALAALVKREKTGVAERAEVSAMETLASIVPYMRVQYSGRDKRREGGTEAGVRLMPCADGWISMTVGSLALRDKLAEILEIPADEAPADLFEGAFAEVVGRTMAFYATYTRRWKAEDLFYALTVGGLTCGKAMSLLELLQLDQLVERRFFRDLAHPDLGRLRLTGPPAILTETPAAAAAPEPAPKAPSTVESLRWTPRTLHSGEATRRAEGPLEGVRVLDLTQAWIGPFATLLLADLGAEVIKIESHKRPDVWRWAASRPAPEGLDHVAPQNRSWYFNSANRDKRSLTLDLRTSEGKALFLRLAESADVVAENFTASVMDDFGLGYSELRSVKPDIVMMSCSGYGKSGPWSQFKTNGSAIEAVAGWDRLNSYLDGAPVLMGFYQADPFDGLHMAATTLVCLFRKLRTGRGEAIDGAMLDASIGCVGELLLQAQLSGEPEPLGNRSPSMSPHGVFPCAGEDRWIAVAAESDGDWERLAAAAGISDPRLATLAGRKALEDELEERLAAWTAAQDAEKLMRTLQGLGIAAGVVRSTGEALKDPHLAARAWFRRLSRADIGEHDYSGRLWNFVGQEPAPSSPPPRLGEHNEQILKEALGLTDEEIVALKAKEVIGAVL